MIDDITISSVLGVLGTYLMHSTLLLGLAWLVASRLLDLRAQEWVWRTALLGGLATTGLQLGLHVEPVAGQFTWAEAPVANTIASVEEAQPQERASRPAAEPRPERVRQASFVARTQPVAALTVRPTVTQPARLPEAATSIQWKPLVLGAWVLGSLIVAAGFLLALARLRVHLAGRKHETTGPLAFQLQALASDFPIAKRARLYTSKRVLAPIAHGWIRPSITVPKRAVDHLPKEEQRAMLAHELGHLERRDPLWLTVARLLEIALFFQPLNRLAHRRLASLAEFQCDAAALRATGDRVAMARCLTEVAGWVVGAPRPLPACGMADPRSPLAARVVRILEYADARPQRAPLGTGLLAGVCVAAVAWSAPSIAAPAAPRALEAKTAPVAVVPTAQPRLEIKEASQPAAVETASELDVVLRMLIQERDGLLREVAGIRSELGNREAPPEFLVRVDELERETAGVVMTIERLKPLVAEYRARQAAAARDLQGKSN